MQPATLTPELLAAAPGIASRLAGLVAGLVALIARAFLRHPRHAGIILPLCTWLSRTARRFTRVMQKLGSGTLRPRAIGPGRATSGTRPVPLPRQRAWLLVELKHEGAYYAQRLEALLAEPEIAALVAATPQAQRLLRPLCRMLGIQPEAIRPPRRTPPAAPSPGATPARSVPHPAAPPRQPLGTLDSWCSSGHAGSRPACGPPEPPARPTELCPRLLTRWPFVLVPAYRPA